MISARLMTSVIPSPPSNLKTKWKSIFKKLWKKVGKYWKRWYSENRTSGGWGEIRAMRQKASRTSPRAAHPCWRLQNPTFLVPNSSFLIQNSSFCDTQFSIWLTFPCTVALFYTETIAYTKAMHVSMESKWRGLQRWGNVAQNGEDCGPDFRNRSQKPQEWPFQSYRKSASTCRIHHFESKTPRFLIQNFWFVRRDSSVFTTKFIVFTT